MIKIIVDEHNIVWASAEEIILEDDFGILNPGEPDEAGNIHSGERLLYINNAMNIVDVEELPEHWVAGAYLYVNDAFVLDEESTYWQSHLADKARLKKESVPQSVTMRQARLALIQAGVYAQVPTTIASLPSPQKEVAEVEWEYSSEVFRNRPLVQMLGVALGLSEDDLDELFINASKL